MAVLWPILLANCLAFGATCTVVWRIARRLHGEQAALLAAAITPLVPQCMRYVGMTEVESFMSLWTALLVDTGLILATRPGVRSGAAFGVAAGAATLTKPVTQLYPFVFLAFALWDWRKRGIARRPMVEGAAAAMACFALLLLPWVVRNIVVTHGQFMGLSSNAPGEYLRGNVNVQPKYYLLQQDFGGSTPGEKWDPEANVYEARLMQERGLDRESMEREPCVANEITKDHAEGAIARQLVLKNPGAALRKYVIQTFTFWYIAETRAKSVFVGAIAVAMLTLTGFGAALARRRGVVVWPLILIVLYCNAIYAILLSIARYSAPLYASLVAGGSGAIAFLLDRILPGAPFMTGAFGTRRAGVAAGSEVSRDGGEDG
jgi:4-amino-4-deoxy-L-arabinose transferase-like glycosyltransferase